MVGAGRWTVLGVALALGTVAWPTVAAAADPVDSEREGKDLPSGAGAASRGGFTMLAGMALPSCNGQPESCPGGLGVAPSLQGFVLFNVTEHWSLGVMGQVARSHWQGSYDAQADGLTHTVESDLTSGLVGFAARIVLLPERVVSPVIQLALGSAFQTQTGSNFHCSDGLIPTGQAAIGGRARLSSSVALFAMASASGGIKGGCAASDGPPVTPFVGWGYGFHVGASFDIIPGGAKAPLSLAAR